MPIPSYPPPIAFRTVMTAATWKAAGVARRLSAPLIALLLTGMGCPAAFASPAYRCPSSDATRPCLTLSPNHGGAGTRVIISGRISHRRDVWADAFKHPVLYAGLVREVTGPAGTSEVDNDVHDFQIHFDRSTGRVRGHFTVTDGFSCFQGCQPGARLQPGWYSLNAGCHACQVAMFKRTSAASTLPFTGGSPVDPLSGIAAGCLAAGAAAMWSGRRRTGV